jgi:hypothetical protein
MGSSKAPATTTQINKVELPAWVDQASQENYNLAKDVSGRPLQQYEGQTVAGPSAMTTQAGEIARAGVGAENPLYDEAAGLLRKSTGDLDIQKFLNPYRSEVESNAIRNANESLDRNLLGVSDKARQARAFGGSRSAVESGVARAEGTKGIGDLSARLRSEGFNTATTTALADRAKYAPAAQGLLSLGQARQGARQQDLLSLMGLGGQEEGRAQRQLDANVAKFEEARNYPVEQLNMRLAALGMSPYGRTETGTKTSTQEKLGPDFATLGLGFLKVLPGLVAMSDRNMKTDIKRVGEDPLSGIPIYSYRYKDDPKTYPKVVGPMAQDIEKKYPSAVKKVGRHKVVDIHNLMEVLS